MPARWLLLLVLLLPWRAHATIFLAWEFDRAYQPAPTGFDLALEGPIRPGTGQRDADDPGRAKCPLGLCVSPRRRVRDVLCRARLPRARDLQGHRLCRLGRQEEWAIEYVYDGGRHGAGVCRPAY